MTNISIKCEKHGIQNIDKIWFNAKNAIGEKVSRDIVILECGCPVIKVIKNLQFE